MIRCVVLINTTLCTCKGRLLCPAFKIPDEFDWNMYFCLKYFGLNFNWIKLLWIFLFVSLLLDKSKFTEGFRENRCINQNCFYVCPSYFIWRCLDINSTGQSLLCNKHHTSILYYCICEETLMSAVKKFSIDIVQKWVQVTYVCVNRMLGLRTCN